MNNLLHLVKKDNNSLEQMKLKKDIVESIISGECTIPEDIVTKFEMDYDRVIELFSDNNFIALLGKASQAKMKMSFYGKDLNRLDQIVSSEDDKIAIQGIKLKAQLTQAIKGNALPDINFVFNLENMVKETEKQINPTFDVEHRKVS